MRIPLLKGAIAVAVLFSISTQAVGAFCYPNGDWEVDPVLFSAQPGRLWDWKDNPILRAARAGIVRSPYRQLQRVCLPRASLYTVWDCGFCGRERTENYDWRWGASEGRLVIINVSRKERMATLELGCRTGYPQFSRIKIESPWFSRELLVSSVKEGRLSETIVIPPGNSFVSFTCDAPRVNNSADPRVLVFRVMNASLKEIDQDAGLR